MKHSSIRTHDVNIHSMQYWAWGNITKGFPVCLSLPPSLSSWNTPSQFLAKMVVHYVLFLIGIKIAVYRDVPNQKEMAWNSTWDINFITCYLLNTSSWVRDFKSSKHIDMASNPTSILLSICFIWDACHAFPSLVFNTAFFASGCKSGAGRATHLLWFKVTSFKLQEHIIKH